jgi:methyl-accepting chemotaxis protein
MRLRAKRSHVTSSERLRWWFRLRAEQADAATAAAENRKAELRRFVDEFKTGVGGILDHVLNSSGEFERVAQTLTETARTTAALSSQSAEASENGVRARPLRGRGLRRAIQRDFGNHPPRWGIERHRGRSGQAGRRHRSQNSRKPARGSGTSWRWSLRSPSRPPVGAECDDRGGEGGRCGPRLCHGRQEVKSLVAKATEEISSQIAGMQLATEESVGAISQTIERISEIASSISAAVEQQRGATQTIARSVRAAASGTADVAINVRNAAQGASETGDKVEPDVCLRPGLVQREPASEGWSRSFWTACGRHDGGAAPAETPQPHRS